jgi:hypothetical protein
MLELDATAITTGSGFVQAATPAAIGGSDAFGMAGQGIFHSQPALYQQNLSGQVTWGAAEGVAGNIDINNFNAVYLTDPIFNTGTTLLTLDAASGRGTATIQGMNPNVTYNVAYYVINGNSALLLDTDTTRVLIGTINSQF